MPGDGQKARRFPSRQRRAQDLGGPVPPGEERVMGWVGQGSQFSGDFPGGPVVRTRSFPLQGRGFHPWSENSDPHVPRGGAKIIIIIIIIIIIRAVQLCLRSRSCLVFRPGLLEGPPLQLLSTRWKGPCLRPPCACSVWGAGAALPGRQGLPAQSHCLYLRMGVCTHSGI